MCSPLPEEQNMQPVQAPIAVQAEQHDTTQMQEQAVEQEQLQQQTIEQVQQVQPPPAAPEDAAPAQTQHKKKTEEVARISRAQVLENLAVGKTAFQEILLNSVQLYTKSDGSKQYKEVMQAIRDYVSMNLEKASTDKQSAALVKVRRLLRQYSAMQGSEADIINRYRLLFDSFLDGKLQLPQNMEQECFVDYSHREVDLPPLKLGIKPSWKDVSDQPLFAHEPSANDIQQRMLGDCYLQAAISSLVLNTSETLKQCLRDNGDGTVTVRFFKEKYDVWTDLPAYYQKKAVETDPVKLTDQDLLMRLLVNWGLPDQEQALQNAYADQLTSTVTLLLQTPGVAQKTAALQTELQQASTDTEKELVHERVQKHLHEIEQKAKEELGLDLIGRVDLDHVPQAEALAAQIYAHPEFGPARSLFQQARQSGRNVMDVLSNIVRQFENIHQIVGQLKTDKKELFDALQAEVPMHPVYVTVKKTVPRLAGVDTYAANSLWMQMIEKAYAASGLHIEDVETRMKGVRSYEQIEGGYSDKFLQTLTGKPIESKTQNAFTPLTNLWGANVVLTGQAMRQMNAVDIEIAAVVCGNLQQQLEKRFVRSYTATQNNQPVTQKYALSALTIEDIREEIMNWRHWEMPKNLVMGILSKHHPNGEAFIDNKMSIIADILENLYARADTPNLEYRRFAQNADGTPKYTSRAENQYEAIQAALAAGKIVSVGTQRFIPEEVQGHGLNGESQEAGLVQGHAYSVVGCEVIDGRKYITLRNPWARFERNYVKVTEKDGRVHYDVTENTQGLFAQSDNSGTFHMELNDFMGSVNHIYING